MGPTVATAVIRSLLTTHVFYSEKLSVKDTRHEAKTCD